MTCIAGLVHNGCVYIGGDSAGVGGWDLTIRADAKVFKSGDFIFGCTTSFRMTQLLRHALDIPHRHPRRELMAFMATQFIDSVRACLKAGGWSTTKEGQEHGGAFLVGHAGRLFAVHEDFQVAESTMGFDAVGCGAQIALGNLYAHCVEAPELRIRMALEAAQAFSAGVRGPFVMEQI